jgi:hypothetical protein
MTYLDAAKRPDDVHAAAFGFKLERADGGWQWTAFDLLGQVAGRGVAPSKAAAAASVIRALART